MNEEYFRDSDLFARIQAAETVEEQGRLVIEALLDSLSPDLRAASWAAAVPHWFDAEILAALLERPVTDCAALYAELQTLPFVESFKARGGHNIHELTRAIMLGHLWRERRGEYLNLSARAASYFSRRDETEWQTERTYHLFNVELGRGPAELWINRLLSPGIGTMEVGDA
jgi:muconolactone delta-isomerase